MEFFHCFPDFLKVMERGFCFHAHHDSYKFFPAVTSQKVRGALQVGRGRIGYGGNDLIPCRVAKGVVVQFEFVDIEYADSEGQSQSAGFPPFCHAVFLVAPPVGDAGELVYHGLLHEMHLVVEELDMGVGPCFYGDGAEGLGDVVHCSQSETPLLMLYIRESGNQNYGNVFRNHGFLKSAQQGETIHFRHDDVEKNQGKMAGFRKIQAVLTFLACSHLIILFQYRF